MKTIVATYQINREKIGCITGKFRQFPGEGPLTWTNAAELERRLNFPLPKTGYAENIHAMIQHLGKLLGAQSIVTESGSWEEIPQDDLIEH